MIDVRVIAGLVVDGSFARAVVGPVGTGTQDQRGQAEQGGGA